jgi:hypothetical protein
LFFSAVGNYEGSYWQGTYAPVALSGSLTCPISGQTDAYVQLFGGATTNILTLHGQLTAPIVLQWADPWNANTSNFDLYVLDQNYNLLTCVPGAGSTDTYDLLSNPNLPAGTYRLAVGTATAQAAGKLLKLLVVGDGISQLSTATSGGIFSPHKYVNGVITVGAVNGADGIGATIEPYSSTGPVTLAFPASSLQAPLLVAPDNIFVDVLGTGFASQAPTGQFRGTSAAAPNAAAVAALLTAAFPGASTTQVLTALKQGATSLGLGQPNNTFGFGRIDAMGALIAIPAPAVGTAGAVIFVAGSSSSTQTTLMLAGTGNLSASVISDNAALLPASAVALNPATCQSANTCLVTLTPQPLQTGVAHLTFTVSDGAHRSATGALTLTVNKPAPPSIVVTGMGTQEVKLGAAVTPATVALTGSGALSLRVVSSNPALLPDGNVTLSAAPCGSSGSACLVNMSPVAGASGTATVTVSATDGYGQSAATTVTLTVDAPPPPSSGGGGSLDLIVIGALAGIAALRRRRVVSKRRTSLPRTSLRTCCD